MKFAAPLLALALAGLSTAGQAADAGQAAIAAIGQVNGIALACKQPAIVSRARNAVQTTVPKSRVNGDAFEKATQAAFLEQGKGIACPDAASLNKRLVEAESQLQTAFPPGQ